MDGTWGSPVLDWLELIEQDLESRDAITSCFSLLPEN